MSLAYKKCRMAYTPLYKGNTKWSAERQARDALRQTVERFWTPFAQQKTGADITSYRFKENLDSLRTPDFTCQLNGAVGNARLLEDFFSVLLIGFDILSVSVENKGGGSMSEVMDLCNYRGHYTIAHTRPFLGWVPSVDASQLLQKQLSSTFDGSCGSSSGAASEAAMQSGSVSLSCTSRSQAAPQLNGVPTLKIPFSTHVECGLSNKHISHMVLRTSALQRIADTHVWRCPDSVKECLSNAEAVKMLATLRRSKVNPSIINTKTLLSASRQNATWASAMGIL